MGPLAAGRVVMYRISKDFTFAASHRLDHLPVGHKCHRLHGHNYVATITLASAHLDEDGFVEDFGALADVRELLERKLDHRHLNDVLTFPPTAELLASWLFDQVRASHPDLSCVTIAETPTSRATYLP